MSEGARILVAKDIHVSMKKKQILKNINLSLEKGKIYGLLGPNGAGKTTLLKVLLGIFPPSSGEVLFEDFNLYKHLSQDVIHSIGSIIEFPGFYENLTLFENIELHLRYLNKKLTREQINNILKTVGLYEHRDKLFSQTSLGMKQRLGIGRAIAHKPKLLLLDEPTNGLDPHGIKEVREMLLQEVIQNGTTVIISSHLLSEINLMADELLIMNNGEIIFESAFMKNSQAIYLYKLPLDQDTDLSLVERYANHIIMKDERHFEFISVSPPDDVKKHLKSCEMDTIGIECYQLSLEDLYLKLLTKEKNHEFVSA
ncbi:ABC transporter ATP-binding protein [Bacillus swezeyi]|uniref:ABC transporter ATP-binding protein n=1 Tax=Bacillus swezeyi TaxID=1925020 RepID=UPI003F8BF6A0